MLLVLVLFGCGLRSVVSSNLALAILVHSSPSIYSPEQCLLATRRSSACVFRRMGAVFCECVVRRLDCGFVYATVRTNSKHVCDMNQLRFPP
jgi:hypothetical protein